MCIRNSNILTLSVNFQSMTLLLFPPAICLGDFGRNAAQLGSFSAMFSFFSLMTFQAGTLSVTRRCCRAKKTAYW